MIRASGFGLWELHRTSSPPFLFHLEKLAEQPLWHRTDRIDDPDRSNIVYYILDIIAGGKETPNVPKPNRLQACSSFNSYEILVHLWIFCHYSANRSHRSSRNISSLVILARDLEWPLPRNNGEDTMDRWTTLG